MDIILRRNVEVKSYLGRGMWIERAVFSAFRSADTPSKYKSPSRGLGLIAARSIYELYKEIGEIYDGDPDRVERLRESAK